MQSVTMFFCKEEQFSQQNKCCFSVIEGWVQKALKKKASHGRNWGQAG